MTSSYLGQHFLVAHHNVISDSDMLFFRCDALIHRIRSDVLTEPIIAFRYSWDFLVRGTTDLLLITSMLRTETFQQ